MTDPKNSKPSDAEGDEDTQKNGDEAKPGIKLGAPAKNAATKDSASDSTSRSVKADQPATAQVDKKADKKEASSAPASPKVNTPSEASEVKPGLSEAPQPKKVPQSPDVPQSAKPPQAAAVKVAPKKPTPEPAPAASMPNPKADPSISIDDDKSVGVGGLVIDAIAAVIATGATVLITLEILPFLN